ncbi:MAG TPA: hypothetical protein VK446_09030 [Methylocystis sp.]|nr:hypothetical protein [Methylocystis sp.]
MARRLTGACALALGASLTLLSGCEGEGGDPAMGQIMMDCQLNAHNALETSTLSDEQRHFAVGEQVEHCLKEMGLQPLSAAGNDATCFEAPNSPDDGKGFIKPLQKCWKNPKASKG